MSDVRAADLIAQGTGVLTRSHLSELGLTRTMVDSVFRSLDVVQFPDSKRVAVKVEDYVRSSSDARTATIE